MLGLFLLAGTASLLLHLMPGPGLIAGMMMQGIARSSMMTVAILLLMEAPGVPPERAGMAGGILAARTGDFDPKTQVIFFMAIDKVKFRKPVTPGDQLVIEVEPLRKGRVWKLKGVCTVDGEVVSQGEFLATMAPREA